ncbi:MULTISPECIES: hypothetical protein [Streptomyces]|uniref:DUF4034 domain-containing protein n=1 Tax=Streptomyces sviceus (strain ATCC 29083 / DSM 924 / JCM 4929 / NBRC 13980 / NCIMB 11184 / NRRL 5439 / UC 5370) TaxID=463191 RepID=B5HPX5_STRX2|nr:MULTISPECIES: hypothetical protein [Streptomyces]EDY54880.1 conserved hypothetical protein [Streptomyces sviceus ATCC 29083]
MGESTVGGGTPLVTDPFDAVPGLAPLRAAAWDGDWAATRAFFEGIPVADAEGVSFAAALLAGVDRTEWYLEKAAKAEPADPLPRTLLAERYIHLGWRARGRGLGKDVSRDQVELFHDWLRKAELLLIEVCAERPAYVPAWTARLATARGLVLGQSEARRRYDRLAEHYPHHVLAQSRLLQQLCPKWGGSWEAAHGFAQECASAAPEGSHAGVLVAEAHVEHCAELDGAQAREYLRDVSVRDELRRAARASVLHPDHRRDWQWTDSHSTFALAFSLGGHLGDAARHFAALGDTVSESFWRNVPDWKTRFTEYRSAASATL